MCIYLYIYIHIYISRHTFTVYIYIYLFIRKFIEDEHLNDTLLVRNSPGVKRLMEEMGWSREAPGQGLGWFAASLSWLFRGNLA